MAKKQPRAKESSNETALASNPKLEQAASDTQRALAAFIFESPSFDTMLSLAIQQKVIKPICFQIEKDGEKKEVEGFFHERFEDVLSCIRAGNVFLVGPTGSGKTNLAAQLAEVLGINFYFTGAIQFEHKLVGFMDATGGYSPTSFRKAYEFGGVFLFDEIDASSPNALLAFNAALSNNVMDFPDGQVTRHKDFFCIAAANTWGAGRDRVYVGRNQLDAATLNRFIQIDMDYDKKLERAISSVPAWTDFVIEARGIIEKAKIRHIISPRQSIDGGKLLSQGMGWKKVARILLWRDLDDTNIEKITGKMSSYRDQIKAVEEEFKNGVEK